VRYSGTCNTTTCASTTVTVDEFTTATAGTDQIVCISSATLAANPPTTGSGVWSVIAGAGTFAAANSPTSGVSGLSNGVNTFRWTLANGACTNSQDDVSITRQTLSTAPTSITGTVAICNGSSTTLNLSVGTPGTGATAEWFEATCGSTVIGTGNSISVSPTTTTTYLVRYNGTCNTTTCASVVVTVDQFTTSAAGPNQTLCASSATLAANAPTTGSGAWTVIVGSGTFAASTSPTSGVSGLGFGTNTFRWTLANGLCGNSVDDISIIRETQSTAPAGITGNLAICAGESTTLTMTAGTPGAGAVVEWYSATCGGTSAGSGVNAITVSPTTTTTYFVRYEGTCNNSGCAQVTVVVTQVPADPGFGNGTWNTTAYNGGNINLTGTYYGFYTDNALSYNTLGRWGSGSTPTNANATNGTVWQGCVVPIDNHVVVSRRTGFTCGYYQLDMPNHDDDIRLYIDGTLVWSHEPGCCDVHTNIWTGYLDASSEIEVRHFEGGAGSHQSLTLNVTGSTSTAPTSISGTATVCAGSPTTLTGVGGSLAPGGSFVWYAGGCGSGSSIGTGNSVTVFPTTTTTYYVRAESQCGNSGCVSRTVTANSAPSNATSVSASPSTIIQGNSSNLNATSAGNNIAWYTTPSGGTSIGQSTSGANFPVSPSSTTTYYAEADGGSVGNVTTYNYTGGVQNWTVPAGVSSINIVAYGAQGGSSIGGGGLGGMASGTLSVTPGQVVSVYVGGQNGYNGGGAAGTSNGYPGSNGGGGTDVRYGGTALGNRVIVAGGGGGGGGGGCCWSNANGGYGGGSTGGNGTGCCGNGPGGGTQSAGGAWNFGSYCANCGNQATNGSLGQGGRGDNGCESYGTGSGGGGGYYGGGGGESCGTGRSGGGGSGYTGGVSGGSQSSGVRSGNGQVSISYDVEGCTSPGRVAVTVTVTAPTTCTHTISLYDTYGDGWHNNNFVYVYINSVYQGSYTLGSGYGPANYTFQASDGDAIMVTYSSGSWAGECYYTVRSGNFTNLVTNWFPNNNGTWMGTADCP